MNLESLIDAATLAAFFQVLLIDIALAGDNAVAVGLAAAGLPPKQRRQAILLGLGAAVVMRIGFAIIAVQLLSVVGLLLAGGVLLLWVCWKMWRELRDGDHHQTEVGESALDDATGHADAADHAKLAAGAAPAPADAKAARKGKPKTMMSALLQILAADLSMSLDNVLAVAGAAREHPWVLVFGLLLSITLMGLAANWIAGLLSRFRWIGYLGLVIILYVSLHMMWEGHRSVVIDLKRVDQYNAVAPAFLDINKPEIDRHMSHKKH